MLIHPTTVVIGSLLFMAISTAAPRAKSADSDRRDPAVHEAQAAAQEARQGKLKNNANREERVQNKYARCEYLPAEDRQYCIRRINGEGTVTGSVEGGGLLRELRVIVPAQPQSQ